MDTQTLLPSNGQPKPEAPPNPFDPSRLRLSQNFAATVGVKKVLTTVPCRKPNRHEFVRVRAGESWRLETGIFEDKQNRETYLVEPALWPELMSEIFPACLFYAVTRQGDPMLWPVRLPGTDGKSNPWNESALAAAKLAESKWVRVAANMAAGMYDVFEAASELAQPRMARVAIRGNLTARFQRSFYPRYGAPSRKGTAGGGLAMKLAYEDWLFEIRARIDRYLGTGQEHHLEMVEDGMATTSPWLGLSRRS